MKNNHLGFTLAETLITLGIIGVVAAMTLPGLVANYKVKVIVASMKKTHTVLSQAFMSAVSENGNLTSWGDIQPGKESVELVAEKIKPYLKILDDCGTDFCENYSVGQLKYLNGHNTSTEFSSDSYYKLRLADGTALIISGTTGGCYAGKSNCLDIFIDTNGRKEPNTLGMDIFHFNIGDTGKVSLSNINLDPKANSYAACNPKTGEGWGCAAWVYYKENMDYLKCADELSWNGKDRCN